MKNTWSFETKTWAFIAAVSLLKVIYASGLDLMPDEAYYFLWSRKLAFSYFDHPPMIAYVLALPDPLSHNHAFNVRLATVLLSALTSVYAFLLARELYNSQIGFYYVLLSSVTLLFTAGSLIATPDTPMIFFLTAACYYFYLAVKRNSTTFWVVAGALMGFALLSKYTSVLVYGSFFLYLVLLQENRKWFTRFQPYLAFVVSWIIFLPVILWNAAHNWISFCFQFNHGFGGSFPNWLNFFDYLGGQAAIAGPVLFVLFLMAMVAVVLGWKTATREDKFLWCLASVVFGFFLVSALQKKVEANWPAFAYVPGILLVIRYYERILKHATWGKKLWRANWGLCVTVLLLLLTHIYVPFIPIHKDRTDEFFGWGQLGAEAARLAAEHPDFSLAANRHQYAGELAVYSGLPVTCLNIAGRANQFDLWQEQTGLQGKNFLLFDGWPEPKQEIVQAFERVEPVENIQIFRRNKKIRTFHVFRAYHYRGK